MKIIGLVMLIGSFVTIGYRCSNKFNVRINFLQQYLQFIAYIETKIRYSPEVIYDLVDGYRCENEFKDFLELVSKEILNNRDFESAWNYTVTALSSKYGLCFEDRELLKSFSKNIGTSDIDGQLNYCQLNKELARDRLNCAKEAKEKKGKLYFMLWSILGVSLALVLA